MTKENIKIYETVSEFIAACDKPVDPTWAGSKRSSRGDRGNNWHGTSSYEEAVKLAVYGWEKGLSQMNDGIAKIQKETTGKVTIKSIAGSHPDVARFIAGMPDCMNTRVYSDAAKKPCIDIAISASYSASIRADQIMNYGIAVASLIDDLESNGYSIQLAVASISINHSNVNQGCLIKIKNHGEAMDMGKLVYFIAHPSFLRRLAFSHWEANNTQSDLYDGYGTIADLPKNIQGDLYFGKESNLSKCNDINSAIEYVQSVVTKQMPDLIDREAA